MPSDRAPVFPAQFAIAYPVRRCGTNIFPDGAWPTSYTSPVSLSDAGFPNVTGTGGKLTLRSTALALYSTPAGPASNKATLDALAVQMVADFVNWRSVGFDQVYNGVINPAPSALNDVIEYTYLHHDQSTRVRSRPWGGEPTEYQHQDGAVSGCVTQGTGAKNDDQAPGVMMDIPGGSDHTHSLQGRLTLEDGRLVMAYEQDANTPCACGPCTLCVTTTNCPSGTPISGATVTVTQGTTSIGSCVSDATGKCCVPVPGPGIYFVEDNYPPIAAQFRNVLVVCPKTDAFFTGSPNICVRIICCSAPQTGTFSVTITNGTDSYTDGGVPPNTVYCIPYNLTAGTWTITIVSNSGLFVTVVTSATITAGQCNTVLKTVTPNLITGYCCEGCSGFEITNVTTFFFTSMFLGAVTLTGDCGSGIYAGSTIYNYPGAGFCPPRAITVSVKLFLTNPICLGTSASHVEISYKFDNTGCPNDGGANTEIDHINCSSCSVNPIDVEFIGNWNSGVGTGNLIGAVDTVTVTE